MGRTVVTDLRDAGCAQCLNGNAEFLLQVPCSRFVVLGQGSDGLFDQLAQPEDFVAKSDQFCVPLDSVLPAPLSHQPPCRDVADVDFSANLWPEVVPVPAATGLVFPMDGPLLSPSFFLFYLGKDLVSEYLRGSLGDGEHHGEGTGPGAVV
ncbi:hypothetical protein LWC34_45330 [Kibdelosporangium philippinense]|uniref:Uncharacterized protein n=1 Tax=Kibdelosporangium philippinense TaxID=211113 RepID=A0ABS8ZQF2_9PSEU|nr:hypothetical protein [Kibdelosporangium philippinense]MCE7009983.1 hypothetical protein [Kibdelosporangium philippinense]